METFPVLLALCERNSPVTGEFPSQGPATRSFDVFFDMGLNRRLKCWSSHRDAGDLRRHPVHYDITVIKVDIDTSQGRFGEAMCICWFAFTLLEYKNAFSRYR